MLCAITQKHTCYIKPIPCCAIAVATETQSLIIVGSFTFGFVRNVQVFCPCHFSARATKNYFYWNFFFIFIYFITFQDIYKLWNYAPKMVTKIIFLFWLWSKRMKFAVVVFLLCLWFYFSLGNKMKKKLHLLGSCTFLVFKTHKAQEKEWLALKVANHISERMHRMTEYSIKNHCDYDIHIPYRHFMACLMKASRFFFFCLRERMKKKLSIKTDLVSPYALHYTHFFSSIFFRLFLISFNF